MKSNRISPLKLSASLLIVSIFFYLSIEGGINSIQLYNQVGVATRLQVAGLLNNISYWIMFGCLLFLFICLFYKLITKTNIPLPIGTFLLLFSIIGGVIGLVLDSMTREKIQEQGYQECSNEAYFSRNASYKVFVLSQADCKDK